MGIGSGTAALIGGLASAGGSVASGILGSNAASSAASEQARQQNRLPSFNTRLLRTHLASKKGSSIQSNRTLHLGCNPVPEHWAISTT